MVDTKKLPPVKTARNFLVARATSSKRHPHPWTGLKELTVALKEVMKEEKTPIASRPLDHPRLTDRWKDGRAGRL